MNSFLKKILHIFPVLPLMLVMLSGCVDDYFESDSTTAVNPDVVSFATSVSKGEPLPELARGGSKPLYEPLQLGDESGEEKLYLHTYDADEVSFNPETSQPDTPKGGVQSRGLQVESVQDLISIHKDFLVHARFADNPEEEFIEWSTAKQVTGDNTIWQPYKTRYWPIEEVLAFHAVAPAAEYSSIQSLALGDNTMSFSYSAKTSTGDSKNKDAEAQTDLLIAASKCNKAGSDAGKAPLQFHHALSAIKFAIRDVANGTIDNIKISGVYGTADCVYTYADNPVDPNPDEPTDPWQGTIAWSNHRDLKTGDAAYSQDFAFAFNQTVSPIKPEDGDKYDIPIYGDSKDGKMPEKTFMLIPQAIPDDAEIIVTITRSGEGFDNTSTEGANRKTVTLRGKIKANGVDEWLPGHEYIYTLSSTADNWVYVFDAIGNHNTNLSTNTHFPDDVTENLSWHTEADMIFIYAPMNTEFDRYEENAHFHVKSYRYLANNPDTKEVVPWKANYGTEDIKQYESNQLAGSTLPSAIEILKNPGNEVTRRVLPNNEWIADKTALEGEGSFAEAGEVKRFKFAPHHAVSSWTGDLEMQDNIPYEGNSEDNPWDLSTCGESGLPKNTANTYVVDRGGWYILPAVYGNAFKNGNDNTAAYKNYPNSGTVSLQGTEHYYLQNFVDHTGAAISSPWIPDTYCKKAVLVWADVYNAVSDVSLIDRNGHKYVKFKVNSLSMLQGNVTIAITGDDASQAVWSWNIWVTEHWLAPNGKPHVFDKNNAAFNFEESQSGRRERGDLQTSIPGYTNYRFYVSPYNLGWCDPKSRYYLRRVGNMKFVQYKDKDKTEPTGNTKTLPMIQNGLRIDYRYGNNTYYQFGRKDAMVGFIDHENTVKRNFGPYQYAIKQNAISKGGTTVTLAEAIKHPNTLYADIGENTSTEIFAINDWCYRSYVNLWNNYGTKPSDNMANNSGNHDLCLNGIKTVYDPCPPGYMVPPASVWRIVGQGSGRKKDDNGNFVKDENGNFVKLDYTYTYLDFTDEYVNDNSYFNGIYRGEGYDRYNERFYSYIIYANRSVVDKEDKSNWIFLASTGHRWYTNNSSFKAGDNFNPQIVYLWSSTRMGRRDRSASGLALGFDDKSTNIPWEGMSWGVCAYFAGRPTMARPIRPVRETDL